MGSMENRSGRTEGLELGDIGPEVLGIVRTLSFAPSPRRSNSWITGGKGAAVMLRALPYAMALAATLALALTIQLAMTGAPWNTARLAYPPETAQGTGSDAPLQMKTGGS
jgi:hypothetical protein